MRIALLGSQGMLGSKLLETAKNSGHSVDSPKHAELDITHLNQVQSYFEPGSMIVRKPRRKPRLSQLMEKQ